MSVVAFAARPHPTANQPQKDLYEVGEIPPLGHVPKNMYAWVIRRERHGPPEQSMQLEVVPTHAIGEDEVLVLVMAAGVNYNGVWAGLGLPISPFDVHKQPFHIAGSDASGIQFAKPLYAFPRVAGKIAWMAVETMIARQLTYFAAREKDQDRRCDIEAGMAKLLAARVAWSNADNALQIHGCNGYAMSIPSAA